MFIVAFGFLIPISTFSQGEAIISGSFESSTDREMVYIKSNMGIQDSVILSNKRFEFVFHPGDQWDVFFISSPDLSRDFMFPVFLKENSQIDVTINKTFDGIKISGDAMAIEQDQFYKGLDSIRKFYELINKKILETKDSIQLVKLNLQLKHWGDDLKASHINWVNKHRESPFSVAVINLFISQTLKEGEDTLAQKSFDLLLPAATTNNYQAYLLKRKFALYNDKYSKIPLNSQVPDFIVKDTSGQEIRLSDFEGSFLLIDFWASWCGPCRENNPLLQKLYDRYKEKGLSVLSISIDIDEVKWKEAIMEDKMKWLQGSDLKGPESGTGFNYHISAVPQYFLIGPMGNIILKSTGGDINLVESKLKKLLK